MGARAYANRACRCQLKTPSFIFPTYIFKDLHVAFA
jgi:hypothetical protein